MTYGKFGAFFFILTWNNLIRKLVLLLRNWLLHCSGVMLRDDNWETLSKRKDFRVRFVVNLNCCSLKCKVEHWPEPVALPLPEETIGWAACTTLWAGLFTASKGIGWERMPYFLSNLLHIMIVEPTMTNCQTPFVAISRRWQCIAAELMVLPAVLEVVVHASRPCCFSKVSVEPAKDCGEFGLKEMLICLPCWAHIN